LLLIADNFRRALEISAETEKSEEFKQFALGIELIRKQLDDVLSSYGVEPVPAVGEVFDPHVHEAIATEKTGEVPPNTILEEIVRGYRLGDKLLRPAMVKVAAAP
jgi:molecular chaperone GrpE